MLQLQQTRPLCQGVPSPQASPDAPSPGPGLHGPRRRSLLGPRGDTPHELTRQHLPSIRHPSTRAEGPNDSPIRGKAGGFCRSLIRSVLIRWYRDKDVFISARKSMTLRVYLHSKLKRAETLALLDSGATESFMSLDYAKHLHLLIKTLQEPRQLFNVDGTPNKAGDLKYYTDLGTRTGTSTRTLRYFLSDLGNSRVILGYPWFAAAQPKIDWARGWIAHNQLPIVLRSIDVAKARFLPQQATARQGIVAKRMRPPPRRSDSVPLQYRDYRDVFEQRKGKGLPPSRTWDHAIDLKPGAPVTLISKTVRLSRTEQGELSEFLKEHTARGTIQPSKSPYAASFFFIKKKNGKLRPVQDYRPVNAWTIKNHYPLPLIPSLIDRL